MKTLKVITISGLSISFIFALCSLIFFFGDWPRLIAVSILGLFVGFIAAPEFEPKAFKEPFLWQAFCGFAVGLTVALYFDLENPFFILSILVGTVLGGTATLWIKHVPIP